MKRMAPAIAGVLTLLECSFFEQGLRSDQSGDAHTSFFCLQSALYLVLSASFFATQSNELLSKCVLFPLRPGERFLFVSLANLRRGVILAFGGSTAFALFLVHRQSALVAVVATLSALLLFLLLELAGSLVFLLLARSAVPAAWGLLFAGVLMSIVIIVTLISPGTEIVTALPPSSWASSAICAAGAGEAGSAFLSLGGLAASSLLALIIGCVLS